MLNRSASLAMSTCVLKALPGKLDIKRHSPSILYLVGHMRSKWLKLMSLVHIICKLHFQFDGTLFASKG